MWFLLARGKCPVWGVCKAGTMLELSMSEVLSGLGWQTSWEASRCFLGSITKARWDTEMQCNDNTLIICEATLLIIVVWLVGYSM